MRKWIFTGACGLHLLACIALSFDWDFLQGEYWGFGITFLLLYCITLPVIIAGLALADGIYALVKKEGTMPKLVCAGIAVWLLLTYLLSAIGTLAGSALLGVTYAVIPAGSMIIVGVWIWSVVKNKKAR
jgi:hypothetical protein